LESLGVKVYDFLEYLKGVYFSDYLSDTKLNKVQEPYLETFQFI